MSKKITQNNRGFTLVEMLVSVAIFSIVVMISLGAILTILDANRKARTLTEVMNNLNFSIEMMTRSLKTGVEPTYSGIGDGVVGVGSIVLEEDGFTREKTRYTRLEDGDGRGFIAQCINQNYTDNSCDSSDWVPITSDLVDVERLDFFMIGHDAPGAITDDETQPLTQIFLSGTVKINERISSSFSLQTSVSQRRLDLVGSELDIGQ